jgi:hypothetical protein
VSVLKRVSSGLTFRSFAVAAACAVATVTYGCSSEESSANDGGGTGGTEGTGGKAGAAGAEAGAGADAGEPTDACKVDDDCTPETECTGGKCVPKAVCPSGIEPTYESIRTKIFAVSCGTTGSSCHSRKGSVNSGGLNLADDPYTALLGSDGKGAPASNIAGSEKGLRRVVPNDPDHSFIVIKLSTKSGQDPKYGSGMPFTAPGSVCPSALDAVRSWIQDGAKQ